MANEQSKKKSDTLFVLLFELAMIGAGFGTAVLNWQSYLTDGSYYIGSELIGPALGFLGLVMLIAPPDRKAAEGEPPPEPSALDKFRGNTIAILAVVGVIATAVNFAYFQGWLPPFWN